jgi:murein DD-endopeptidase MepM/ murein hydrolase activator NlpD
VVQAGDTLWSIATRHGVELSRIRSANQIGDDNTIRVGQTLVIPRVDSMTNGLVASSSLGNVAGENDVEPVAVVQAPARLSVSAPVRGNVIPIPGSAAAAPEAQVTPTAVPPVAANSVASAPQGEVRSASRVRNPGARLQWPALGGISTFFGEEGHSGLDIMGFTGQPVTAAAAGVVTVAMESDGPYGWRVDVDHGSGITTVYGHLSEFTVKVGDQVRAGQRIGSIGNTGLSTGPHLHFEVRTGGVTVDPLDYL